MDVVGAVRLSVVLGCRCIVRLPGRSGQAGRSGRAGVSAGLASLQVFSVPRVRDHGGMTDRAPHSESSQQRKRRLAEVFGAVLPETTSDERAESEANAPEPERWYRENRPPHHD